MTVKLSVHALEKYFPRSSCTVNVNESLQSLVMSSRNSHLMNHTPANIKLNFQFNNEMNLFFNAV